jgi:prepilin-type processing-associated H-X9-DG protein
MFAAGHGDLRMLRWLLAHGAGSTPSAANYAFAGGHTEAEELLASRGCRRRMADDDADMIARIRKTLQVDDPLSD